MEAEWRNILLILSGMRYLENRRNTQYAAKIKRNGRTFFLDGLMLLFFIPEKEKNPIHFICRFEIVEIREIF